MCDLRIKIMLCRDDDLVDFFCFVADHIKWDNFSITYAD